MIGFPLLLIPLAIVNIVVFLMPGVALDAVLVSWPLPSGTSLTVTFADTLLALGIVLLLFEVTKAARPGGKYFMDHALALLVFAGAAAELVLLKPFGSSFFALLTLMALVDFLSGVVLRVQGRHHHRQLIEARRVAAEAAAATAQPAAAARPDFTPASPASPIDPGTVNPANLPGTSEAPSLQPPSEPPR